jgi:hypothetical protein
VELMAAVAVAGVVLAVVAGIALRQQRTFVALSADAALAGQLRDAASMLPMDLRGAAVGAGDVHEATDTSIEVRETIASAVVCDTLGPSIVLAPSGTHATTFAGTIATVHAGDTAWVLAPDDSVPTWHARRVTGVGASHAGQCIPGGPHLAGASLVASRTTLSLDSAPQPTALVGRPLRITHPIRYSLYRSSDDSWYLGVRDWNSTTSKFNAIQPVAGPFEPSGTPVFRWYDTTGALLATPVAWRDRIALVRIDLRGRTRGADRILGSSHDNGPRADSVTISVSVRNRT